MLPKSLKVCKSRIKPGPVRPCRTNHSGESLLWRSEESMIAMLSSRNYQIAVINLLGSQHQKLLPALLQLPQLPQSRLNTGAEEEPCVSTTLPASKVKASQQQKDGFLITFVLLIYNQCIELETDSSCKEVWEMKTLAFYPLPCASWPYPTIIFFLRITWVTPFLLHLSYCETTLLLLPHPAKCLFIPTCFHFFLPLLTWQILQGSRNLTFPQWNLPWILSSAELAVPFSGFLQHFIQSVL